MNCPSGHGHGLGHHHHHRGHAAHPVLPEPTIDENTPQHYRVFHALRTVTRAHKHLMMRRLGEKHSHPGQAIVMWMLAAADGLSPSDLAERLGVSRPTVTVMLRKMEHHGLVQRASDEHDQRVTRIRLTDAGRALHEELHAAHSAIAETAVVGMSDDEQRELERLLRIVERNLEEAS